MTNKFENNVLTINSLKIEFQDKIIEAILFDKVLVLRTDNFESSTNENVYGVNTDGKIVWQIEKLEYFIHKNKKYEGISKPYVSIQKLNDKTLQLTNFDGTKFQVDFRSGKLISDPMESRIGKRPW